VYTVTHDYFVDRTISLVGKAAEVSVEPGFESQIVQPKKLAH
jgi:hypothetical protein